MWDLIKEQITKGRIPLSLLFGYAYIHMIGFLYFDQLLSEFEIEFMDLECVPKPLTFTVHQRRYQHW